MGEEPIYRFSTPARHEAMEILSPNAITQRVSVRHVNGALMGGTGHPDLAPFPFQVCRSVGDRG